MNEEFSDYLLGMNPEDVITFELGAGQRKDFYANTTSGTESIKGAYSISGGETNKIYMEVYDPSEQLVLTKAQEREAVFQMKPNLKGMYRIRFSNKNVKLGVTLHSTLLLKLLTSAYLLTKKKSQSQ